MKRSELASYMLTASLFVLTALVMLHASQRMDTRAHAEMVVNKASVTMLSTQYRGDSEIVYVLDSREGRLLAYIHDPNTTTIKLLDNGMMDLGREFERAFGNSAQPQQAPPKRAR